MKKDSFIRHAIQDLLIWLGIGFGFYGGVDWVANATVFVISAFGLVGILFGLTIAASKDADLKNKAAKVYRNRSNLRRRYGVWTTCVECVAVAAAGHFFLASWWAAAGWITVAGYSHANEWVTEREASDAQ